MSRDASYGIHAPKAQLFLASVPGHFEKGDNFEHFWTSHVFFWGRSNACIVFTRKNAIKSRLPVVFESVNSYANWSLCIQSSGNWAFDFHLLFSLAACSVSMQISFFIQFSVVGKTTISCIIISMNKRETLNWIFMRLQLQREDVHSFHAGRMWTKASGQPNSAPHHLPPLRNFLAAVPSLLPESDY